MNVRCSIILRIRIFLAFDSLYTAPLLKVRISSIDQEIFKCQMVLLSSVVDPDPVGSGSLCRIRIHVNQV